MVDFRQERDLGEILNATFSFLRENFKPLGRVLLLYAGPLILISSISGALFQAQNLNVISSPNSFDPDSLMQIYGTKYFLFLLAAVLANAMLVSVTYSYISLYIERKGANFTDEEVWAEVRSNFFMVLGTVLLSALIIGLGLVLLIIPGIYVAVSISFILIMRMVERNSFGEAFSRCFTLVKDNWWYTLLIIVVVSILVGIVAYVFMIPQMIYTFIYTFDAVSGNSVDVSILYIVLTSLGTFFASLLNSITFVAIALHYFNLVEKKESPALYEKIDEINENNLDNTNQPNDSLPPSNPDDYKPPQF